MKTPGTDISAGHSPSPAPTVHGDSTGEPPAYEPPAIVWEQAFVALAMTSDPLNCFPPRDPRCF